MNLDFWSQQKKVKKVKNFLMKSVLCKFDFLNMYKYPGFKYRF